MACGHRDMLALQAHMAIAFTSSPMLLANTASKAPQAFLMEFSVMPSPNPAPMPPMPLTRVVGVRSRLRKRAPLLLEELGAHHALQHQQRAHQRLHWGEGR